MERRQYPRVESVNLVSVDETENQPVTVARTLVMSQGGALIETAEPYPVHTLFQLDLVLDGELFPVRAEVRHITATEEDTYKLGVRFMDLSAEHRELLAEHLEERRAGEP